MKKQAKRIICGIIFICSFLLMYSWINNLLRPKMWQNDTVKSFYKEEKDSIDIVYVGSSHLYYDISPMQIWGEYGITGYDLGSASQGLAISYYLIKDAIRTQHPEMIVLETWGAGYDKGYPTMAKTHMAVDAMPFSKVKYELFRDFVGKELPKKNRLEFFFPIIRNHGRWQDFERIDFESKDFFLKGHHPSSAVIPQRPRQEIDGIREISDKNKKYLDRIIDVCAQNNVQLMIITTPCAYYMELTEKYEKANALLQYVSDKGVDILDLNDYCEEMGIDFTTDYQDNVHMNIHGARKASAFLGRWLREHYELPDHRGDEAYRNWDEDYKQYEAYLLTLHDILLEEELEDGDE